MDWTAGYNRQRHWTRAQIMARQRRLNQINYMRLQNHMKRWGTIRGFRPAWLNRNLQIINPTNPYRRRVARRSAFGNLRRRR